MDDGAPQDKCETFRAVERVQDQARRSAADGTQVWALGVNDLSIAAGFKANALLARANRRSHVRKALNLFSGVLALLSGASITAVMSELTGSVTVKVLSAAGAFLSGSITLLSTGYFDDEDTQKMFEAAAQFAALQNTSNVEKNHPGLTKDEAFALHLKLMHDFTVISARADRFLTSKFANRAVPAPSPRGRATDRTSARHGV